MNKKEKLELLFKEFPGIGPKQAKRFVYSLLFKNKKFLNELSALITEVKNETKKCLECYYFFESKSDKNICPICYNDSREKNKILIIEKNFDLENIESANIWNGLYFLIGQNLKLTERKPEEKICLEPLISKLKDGNIKELIFALSLNPEGENTKNYIQNIIYPICLKNNIKITELGRGLSLGSEIEYSDKITLSDALKNRK